MDVPMREVTGFNPLRAASRGRVTNIKINADILGIEVLHQQPEIPYAASDIPGTGMRVIHGRGPVLLVELYQTGNARLQCFPLLAQVTAIVIPEAGRAVSPNSHAAHGV